MLNINPPPALLSAETVKEVKCLSTSLLSDSMSGLGVMNYRIKPVAPGMKLAGTAFTVNIKVGNGLAVIASVALIGQGYVLVISGKGDSTKAVFGSLMAKTALKSGIEGVVLDGMVRDIAELREFGVPVFALGAVPAAAEKEGPGEINGSVSCGGIVVNPGDLIVGIINSKGELIPQYATR
jgi:4-hydroxy-4-methyl-2-oxoglutarate aldolase